MAQNWGPHRNHYLFCNPRRQRLPFFASSRLCVEKAVSRSGKDPLQVVDAFRGDDFGSFLEVEHLHRHHAVVTHFAQRGGDGLEIDVAEPGAFEVAIVGVEVGEFSGLFIIF